MRLVLSEQISFLQTVQEKSRIDRYGVYNENANYHGKRVALQNRSVGHGNQRKLRIQQHFIFFTHFQKRNRHVTIAIQKAKDQQYIK